MIHKLGIKRLLITGASGFIGRRLVEHLLSADLELVLLGRSIPESLSLRTPDNVKFLHCDFSDPSSLDRHRSTLEFVDAVAHLGGAVPHSSAPEQDDPVRNIRVNAEATAVLLGHLSPKLKCFCYTSTMDVYGAPVVLPLGENHPTLPTSQYAVTKLAVEGLLRVHATRMGVSVGILRVSHVYGPGDTSSKAIPKFIREVRSGRAPVIYGNGSDTRDYVYVDDVVQAILLSLGKSINGTVNVATGHATSMNDLVTTILRLMNSALTPARKPRDRTPTQIFASIDRARDLLGYRPVVQLEDGLRRTIEWFRGEEERAKGYC